MTAIAAQSISFGLALVTIVYFVHNLRSWRRNLVSAKTTGLPYIIIPCLPYSLLLRILDPVLFPLLRLLLPQRWLDPWLAQLEILFQWNDGYSMYEKLGSDAYFLVAPGGLILLTCDPDAITQVLQTKKEHFPRPLEMYKAIGAFGQNLVSTEGEQWRRQRSTISRALGDRVHSVVWDETINQASAMVKEWSKHDSRVAITKECMDMSLAVINRALFGQRIPRKGEKSTSEDSHSQKYAGMTYAEASSAIVHNVIFIVGLPVWFLRYSFIPALRRAYDTRVAFSAHMLNAIRQGIESHNTGGSPSLISSLIQVASIEKGEEDSVSVDDGMLISNSFLFLIGGHETTATSVSLSSVYLALCPEAQKRVQEDIDSIVGDRDPSTWSYKQDLSALIKGQVGAVMNEELRLVPPVPGAIKRTIGTQSLTFGGNINSMVTIPSGTVVGLSQIAAHRNPNYWPHGPPTESNDPWHPLSNLENDLEEFKPERWHSLPSSSDMDEPDEEQDGKEENNEDWTPFRPTRGTYFPFSEGPRACIGRRFAQIEVVAAIAAMLQNHTIELDLREWASDEEFAAMSSLEKKEIWNKAAKKARESIRHDIRLLISLRLKEGRDIPLRVVPRGQERCFT